MLLKNKFLVSALWGAISCSAAVSQANASDEHTAIYEGEGISSGIYLGMSRSELMDLVESFNPLNVGDHCPEHARRCGFELGPRTDRYRPFVSVRFDEDKTVNYIIVESGGAYKTNYGADLGLEPYEVLNLYREAGYEVDPTQPTENSYSVTVDEIGYAYKSTWRCGYRSCFFDSDHHIYYPK